MKTEGVFHLGDYACMCPKPSGYLRIINLLVPKIMGVSLGSHGESCRLKVMVYLF